MTFYQLAQKVRIMRRLQMAYEDPNDEPTRILPKYLKDAEAAVDHAINAVLCNPTFYASPMDEVKEPQ